jgi:hypothetical protein
MKRLKVLYVGSIFVLSAPLAAQTTPDVASDNELFASYCLGSIQQHTKEFPSLGDPVIDEQAQRTFLVQANRLQAYLRARGLGSGIRSVTASDGVIGAIQRGRADEADCWAHIERCVKKCLSLSSDYDPTDPAGLKCTESCRDENPTCRSVGRCVDFEHHLPP